MPLPNHVFVCHSSRCKSSCMEFHMSLAWVCEVWNWAGLVGREFDVVAL